MIGGRRSFACEVIRYAPCLLLLYLSTSPRRPFVRLLCLVIVNEALDFVDDGLLLGRALAAAPAAGALRVNELIRVHDGHFEVPGGLHVLDQLDLQGVVELFEERRLEGIGIAPVASGPAVLDAQLAGHVDDSVFEWVYLCWLQI